MEKEKAIVTRRFQGCRDGELHPRKFNVGDEVEGGLARTMVAAGYAKKKDLGQAPRNRMDGPERDRSGSASPPDQGSRKRRSRRSKVGEPS